ncbi:MAG: amidohydrolase, partial [Acidobacteria bacterium]|nr:amidohydrolase [Acidobacteriota bacterium]
MHVHCLTEGRPDFCFPLLVANGITSVRDMGGSFPPDVVRRMRADIAAGRLVGPRLLAAPGKIIDGPFPTPREAFMSVNSPEEARGAVAASQAARWDFV